jgi:phage terminase large subunit-like protein
VCINDVFITVGRLNAKLMFITALMLLAIASLHQSLQRSIASGINEKDRKPASAQPL